MRWIDNLEIIQKSIDYIEENLKTEITGLELANNAGFSLYHFYRLFQSAVGMPVMEYILRRKLINSVYESSFGAKIVDVAFLYGFDTYVGFYKAFKKEFGYTPSEFLKKYKTKKPYRIKLCEEEHIMIPRKKLKEVLQYWGLQDLTVKSIFNENTGSNYDNTYFVGTDYVIKVTPNLGRLQIHVELSSALEAAGLNAASAIRTLDGKNYIQDGELYFYVKKLLVGNYIKSDDLYKNEYIEQARYIGEIIGQLHLLLKNIDVVVNEVNVYENTINWALPRVREVMMLPDDICNNYIDVFGKLYPLLPKQIIHRDPNPNNIIVNGPKWGFIDFDLSERNIRIYDPCYTATAILSESFVNRGNNNSIKWLQIYKNIVLGYDSVVKLSEDEKKALPYVILTNQLLCVEWFSEQEKYKELYEANKLMTSWIIDNFEKLKLE